MGNCSGFKLNGWEIVVDAMPFSVLECLMGVITVHTKFSELFKIYVLPITLRIQCNEFVDGCNKIFFPNILIDV